MDGFMEYSILFLKRRQGNDHEEEGIQQQEYYYIGYDITNSTSRSHHRTSSGQCDIYSMADQLKEYTVE